LGVLRRDGLLRDILEGRMKGGKTLYMTNDITVNKTYETVKREIKDREKWANK